MECILNQVDPQFETTQGYNYRLSVLLCQDGFSFLITHAISRKVLKLSSYKLAHSDNQPDEMGGWPKNGNDYFEQLKKTDFSQSSYQRVDIAVASHKITIAPYDFVDQDNELNIISAAYPVHPDEEILKGPVSDQGPVTAVLVPRYVRKFCSEIFPGSGIHPAAAIFVMGLLRKHSQLITRQVFINLYAGFFEITVTQGLRLLYLNAFRYSAPSDVLYYIIFVLEQLGFDPAEEKVTVAGEISENSTIYTELKMYCESLNFISKPEELKYGDAFAEIDYHHYFTLLNIPLCE